ncbi:MAG: ArnT family glycosyltransferase [Anaerolineae bacterium]
MRDGLRYGTGPKTSLVHYYGFTALLLIATLLRFLALPDFPPGVSHDEVAEILIAEGILEGQHAIFFKEAYGQEPLFLYLVAPMRALLGREILALRFVSASTGVLVVAAGARLAKRLFNTRTALITAAGLSVILWPIFWSRVGLRGMLLPLMMCLGADRLWLVVRRERPYRDAALGGLWFGLSAYTYSAARGVLFVLLGFALLIVLLDGPNFRRRWRALLLLAAVAALIALPLVGYLMWNKEVQSRVHEVDAPLQALKQVDLGPVLGNLGRVLGMFTIRGDATERNNYPNRPVFVEPIWGGLFWFGVLLALLRFRDVRFAFLMVWLVVMLLPSVVTIEAPNFVRTLGALPVVMILPAVAADACLDWLCTLKRRPVLVGQLGLAAAFLVNVGLTTRAYFVRWPRIPEVGFVWQRDLASVGDWLDANREIVPAVVGGLSNRTMDAPSLDFLMEREDVAVRWCDSGSPQGSGGGLLLPANGGRLLIPSIVPLNEDLATVAFGKAKPDAVQHPGFREYRLPEQSAVGDALATFEVGVRLADIILPRQSVLRGEALDIFSVWQTTGENFPDMRIFLHLVDAQGTVPVQHDGLDCPAQFWRPGDLVMQRHPLHLPEDLGPGSYTLRVGLYDPETLERYPLVDGSSYYEIGQLEIRDS